MPTGPEIAIIGGGLSGLALADRLEQQGHSYELFEARERFGGRISKLKSDGATYDLGPAWFWPGQPRMAHLAKRFGLMVFDQYAEGTLSYEDEHGNVQRGRGFASMEGSWRIAEGMQGLIDGLVSALPAGKLHLGSAVERIEQGPDLVTLTMQGNRKVNAAKVVLALPPRIAEQGIAFTPRLPDEVTQTLQGIPTWMAGQAKAVATYKTPFWRGAGLSGDAMSRRGPMVEIHDASSNCSDAGALFGFIGVPPAHRQDATALRQVVIAQLERLFGPEAAEPETLAIKDWAQDRFTATALDQQPLHAHPTYGLPPALQNLWNGALRFSGTEVAFQFGGYLEGALEAAENTAAQLT